MRIRKAIIPVAGFGTRFLPATKAQPKEMLSLVDKPVIQYIVEEAVAAGIEQIIFVTSQTKRAIEDHFDRNFELEYRLREKKKDKALAEGMAISDLAKFVYIRQQNPRGGRAARPLRRDTSARGRRAARHWRARRGRASRRARRRRSAEQHSRWCARAAPR